MNLKHYRRPVAVAAMLTAAFFALTAESCDGSQPPSANSREQATQARMQAEAQASVGFPNIVNWNQKRQLKAIIEAFDQPNLITYSYLVNMNGKAVPLCRSQGYGFNEATQYTNPLMAKWETSGSSGIASAIVAQPDPDGLYSPPTSQGTLLMCLTTGGKVLPVRSEPDVITLPVPWEQLDRTGM